MQALRSFSRLIRSGCNLSNKVTFLDLEKMKTNEVTITFISDESFEKMLIEKPVLGYDRKLRSVELTVTGDCLEALKKNKNIIKITPLFYSYVI